MRRLLYSYPVRWAVVLGAVLFAGTILIVRLAAGRWIRPGSQLP